MATKTSRNYPGSSSLSVVLGVDAAEPGSTGGVPPALTVTALADRCTTKAIAAGHFAGGTQ